MSSAAKRNRSRSPRSTVGGPPGGRDRADHPRARLLVLAGAAPRRPRSPLRAARGRTAPARACRDARAARGTPSAARRARSAGAGSSAFSRPSSGREHVGRHRQVLDLAEVRGQLPHRQREQHVGRHRGVDPRPLGVDAAAARPATSSIVAALRVAAIAVALVGGLGVDQRGRDLLLGPLALVRALAPDELLLAARELYPVVQLVLGDRPLVLDRQRAAAGMSPGRRSAESPRASAAVALSPSRLVGRPRPRGRRRPAIPRSLQRRLGREPRRDVVADRRDAVSEDLRARRA